MLHMQNLRKVFRTSLVETHALRDLTLTVNAGEFVAVTGPSGSGKTTFLNIAGLLEEHTDGVYKLDDIDVKNLNDDARSRLRNEKIGFIFQNFNLIPVLDVRENVEFPLLFSAKPPADAQDYIDRLVEQVGLSAFVKHRPDELSGGQRQRVAIARALATRPRLVIADEPTANLDTETAMTIIDLMQKLNREFGVTFIFSTHDQRLIRRAHRVVELEDGRVVQKPDEQESKIGVAANA